MQAPETPLVFCPRCRREFAGDATHCPTDGTPLGPVPAEAPGPADLMDDRYLIVERIGAGGMGTILRAVDLDDRAEVAVKVLKPRFAQDMDAVAQFYHEARAARRLHHPNVVRLHDFGRSAEGHLYLAMELLGGFPLSALVSPDTPLPPSLVVAITRQVCAALAAAHRKGIIHRDLKPENIQVIPLDDGECLVKVLDFGIARVLSFEAAPESRGRDGNAQGVSGTPAYMSPEQVMGRDVDPRSDLYGLGVLLFEMLTGRPPFDADTPVALCRKHLTEAPPDLAEAVPAGTLPAALPRLVNDLLQKNPAHRPRTVGVVARRLAALADVLGPPVPLASIGAVALPEAALRPRLRDPAGPRQSGHAAPGSRRAAPLVRGKDGSFSVMSLKHGVVNDGDDWSPDPELEGRPTLPDMGVVGIPPTEAQTLRCALWVCVCCGRLTDGPNERCRHCGAFQRGARVGVPAAAGDPAWDERGPARRRGTPLNAHGDGARLADEAWNPRETGDPRAPGPDLDDDRQEVPGAARAFWNGAAPVGETTAETRRHETAPPSRLTPGRVVAPIAPPRTTLSVSEIRKVRPPAAAPTATPEKREIALLHAVLCGEQNDGTPLATPLLRRLLARDLDAWMSGVERAGGIVVCDAGHILRVAFGLLPTPPETLARHAVAHSRALCTTVSNVAESMDVVMYVRAALAVAPVFLPDHVLADPGAAVARSPVDVATRMAVTAPAGELVVNNACWRRVAGEYQGQACDTLRARGSRHPELMYRVGRPHADAHPDATCRH